MSRNKRNREVHLISLMPVLDKGYVSWKTYYPCERVDRSFEQIYKRNNWLKRHGYPKRRKPFVLCWVLEDEYEKILLEMLRMGLSVEQELEAVKSWKGKRGKEK